MKLFDIVGGKVVIHADFLAIPAMRRDWESSSDKDHVNKVLSFPLIVKIKLLSIKVPLSTFIITFDAAELNIFSPKIAP